MAEYLELCKTNEIPEGEMKGIEVNGQKILVANIEGDFYAMDAVCSHMKGDLPSGKLRGK
ncbi:nitrite reductase/ring-hydroxylating ferredoxin subunit [Methanohalophilus levihalophilus]|uniref:Rieske (2Fe-2S) protein n=1 Tax=Methanohalophilus levihalophilus TaxID=1431282 RepID=UPI001AE72F84|nr:Rieske 2Fe-2S domain-containing protein [Methanohalophilus levihalophilus]MBP2031293.1 nitrite reductase/ring-hydroxylating ferredoxin subunit [Methanohalophilus levihalophilus]